MKPVAIATQSTEPFRRVLLTAAVFLGVCAACSSAPSPRPQDALANASACPRESIPAVLNLCGATLDLPFNGAVIVVGPSSAINKFAFRDKNQRINVAEKELVPGLHALQPYERGDVQLVERADGTDSDWRVLARVHFDTDTPTPRSSGPKVRSIRSCRGRLIVDLQGRPQQRVSAVVLDRVMPGVGPVASTWTYPPDGPSVEFKTDVVMPGDSAGLAWIDASGRFSERSPEIVVRSCE